MSIQYYAAATVGLLAGAVTATLVHRGTIRQLSYNAGFGMLNRSGFEHASRKVRGIVDVVFIDMDCFKAVNTSCGYQRSNELVREAFSSFRNGQDGRRADVLLGQRFSGDEYALVDSTGDGTGHAERLLARLHAAELSPAEREQYEALTGRSHLSATIVVAAGVLVRRPADLAAALLRCEAAVSAAKAAGERGTVRTLGA